MPPKRKRAENTAETSSRVTRATSSAMRATNSTTDIGDDNSGIESKIPTNARNAKKVRTGTKTSKKGKGQEKRGQDSTKFLDDVSSPNFHVAKTPKARNSQTTHSNHDGDSEASKHETVKEKDEPLKSHIDLVPSVTKYDPKQSLALFAAYADGDSPGLIGPEGFEKLCNDAQIPMDGAMGLILSWQLRAPEMAKLTKEAWVKETDILQVSSLLQLNAVVRDLNDLLILRHPPPARSASKSGKEPNEPYNRTKYWTYAADVKTSFQELYLFSFSLVKPEQSRNIDMETALALWSVLLAPIYPLMSEISTFITNKGTYKAANKDLWNMMLEFCQTIDTNLRGYDVEAAWPTLLDDFVMWKKSELET